jgi:hypothetical protein
MTELHEDEIPTDDGNRHVLVVDENDQLSIRGHEGFEVAGFPNEGCVLLEHAMLVFAGLRGGPVDVTPPPRQGTFWCELDSDGNFLIGSEVVL